MFRIKTSRGTYYHGWCAIGPMMGADEDEPPDSITQTCAAWVAENGRGFLCTTEQ